jgi:hypothetical protein
MSHILKKALMLGFVSLISFNSLAQTEKKETTLAGVYLTHGDFTAGKLKYEIDCSAEKQKIKLHDFFSKPYIDVYYKGEKSTLQKKDIYGYRDCHNNIYRFFANEEYKLEESGGINIYSVQVSAQSGKSYKWTNEYYFSSSPTGEIKPLTIENLKYAFPDNHKFHDALDETFKGGVEVSEFDSFHKMYKVNHIYQMTLK